MFVTVQLDYTTHDRVKNGTKATLRIRPVNSTICTIFKYKEMGFLYDFIRIKVNK